jgi:hypothetical protein
MATGMAREFRAGYSNKHVPDIPALLIARRGEIFIDCPWIEVDARTAFRFYQSPVKTFGRNIS